MFHFLLSERVAVLELADLELAVLEIANLKHRQKFDNYVDLVIKVAVTIQHIRVSSLTEAILFSNFSCMFLNPKIFPN